MWPVRRLENRDNSQPTPERESDFLLNPMGMQRCSGEQHDHNVSSGKVILNFPSNGAASTVLPITDEDLEVREIIPQGTNEFVISTVENENCRPFFQGIRHAWDGAALAL